MIDERSRSVSPDDTKGVRPNLFIVGAPKSGTTALATHLDRHPDVHVAPKELSYFGTDLDFRTRRGKPWHISRADYLAWFSSHEGTRYLADRSVFYLFSKRAAAEINDYDPSSRAIVLLRDPVDQMHSQHSEMLYQGDEDISDFSEALRAEEQRKLGLRIPAGCQKAFGLLYRELASYADQVERYLVTFGPERVCVLLYDDLVGDPRGVHRRLLDFLELDAADESEIAVVNANKELRSHLAMRVLHQAPPLLRRVGRLVVRDGRDRAALRRRIQRMNTRVHPRPPLPDEVSKRLRAEFLHEIERLEELIGRDLAAWKGSA